MSLLDQIDKNSKDNPKDNHIDIQELQDAIKPQGFLTKEENIKGVSVELNTTEKEPIAKTLETTLNQEINTILAKNTLADADIKIIDLWIKLFGSNKEYANTKQDLSKKLDTLVTDIAHNVGKIIAANTAPNKEHYTTTDIKHIQLRANVHFGASVAIDGKRGSSINLSQNTPNAQLTNLYIYRLELANRKNIVDIRKSLKSSQVFDHILQTPNLEAALNSLPDQQAQNKVLLQFLDFYLKEIKQAGMFFENKIGDDALSVLFIYMINAEKYKDDQVQSKFYIDQIAKTKKEIKDFNQNNIDSNYSVAINDRLKALDKLGVNDKAQKIKIYKELLDLCNASQNQDLKNNLLINISTTFTEAEIKQHFGDAVVADLSKTRDKISEDLKKSEKTNDILSQIENKKIGKRSLSRASRDEYAATRPNDANANRNSLPGTIGDYSGVIGGDSRRVYDAKIHKNTQAFADSHVPADVYKLNLPGSEPIVIRITSDTDVLIVDHIQNLINLGNRLDENSYLIMPDYTKEFSSKGRGNGGGGYNAKTMDYAEKEKNILDMNDFAVAKKQKNGDITLHKLANTKGEYLIKPYETITVDQQNKASLTSNLALRSTYTPEMIGVYNDVGDIQNKIGSTQELFNKMKTASIDRGNTNVLGAIFAMTNPLAAPLLDTYIPVEGGLSSMDEKNIYTRATQMGDKVAELQLQQTKLEDIRKQIQKMEKNIDKSKLITPDERKIIQALDAVNFLLKGIEKGGAFDEFVSRMTNPKYVGANNTFTTLGMERIKNNGVKMAFAIGAAVAVMSAPFTGGMSLLGIAALGTLAGMGGSRFGQGLNTYLQNTVFKREVIIDGKTRTITYTDPTDFILLTQGKLSPKDFAMAVGREFAVGTVSMFGFMKAGQIIGKGLGNFVAENPTSPITTIVKKVKPSLWKANDPYTRNIFESVAKKGSEGGFFSKFGKEFTQEIGEEGMEGAADKSGIPGLAMLVTMRNSLTPGVNTKIYENNNVSVAGVDKVGNNSILELHYAGNANELIQHFEKNGFTLNADGTLSKPNSVVSTITDVIRLTPSLASIDVRNMDAVFHSYGMHIDHDEANKVTFPSDIDPAKLKEFQDKFEQSGMGTVVINPDGSFDVRTMDKTIQFMPIISNAPDIVQDVENNVIDEQFDPQAEPTIFDNILDNNVAAQKLGLFVTKFYGKLQNIALNASSITNEADLSLAISSYVVNNVTHFVHEVKHIFGSELVDLYKSYQRAKHHEGKPGGQEFRTIFNKKLKERGTNVSKLVGETVLAKFGIDPHMFFWGGHLATGLLKDHSNTLDKLFHMSFETMQDLYNRKEGRHEKYNPQTVVENSMLDISSRSQALINHLGLDPSRNPEHQKLLDTLLEVHEIGKGEAGKDARYSAGVYNYTPAQLKQKMLLLQPFMDMDIRGKPFRSQVRDLFALGFLGTESVRMPDVENNIDKVVPTGTLNQNFDLQGKTPQDFLLHPNELLEFYKNVVLPDMQKTDIIKKDIMSDISNTIGAKIIDADLKGSVDPSRAIEKILLNFNGDPNKLMDISRGTLVFNNVQDIYDAIPRILAHPDVIKVTQKDNFYLRKTGYRDINLTVQTKTGNSFELQLNTESLLLAKEHGLQIPLDFIATLKNNITNGSQDNYYGQTLDKLMNNEPVFTDTDQKICNLANRYLESRLAQSDPDKKYNDIALPNNKDILTSGHSLYDITRILENTMNEKLNPNKIVPEWLGDMSFDDIKSFHQRVTSFSNLQYDYAYKLSQNIITNP